jgi:hypothetical protein
LILPTAHSLLPTQSTMDSCPVFPADWDLPIALRIRLGHGPGRQRVLDADGHLLLVLHEIPKSHDLGRVGR